MSITLHTVDNGTVNAIDDAKFYEELTNSLSGLVAGGVCTIVSANTIHITSGWGLILGRLFTIEAEDIPVQVSASGTVNGRLKMVIDLSTPDTPISIESEARSSLPALTQEDLNNGGFVYEFALATYNVDELNVTNLVSNTPISITPISAGDKNVMSYRGQNPIASVTDDTVANWRAFGQGIWLFTQSNRLNNQPRQYGILVSFTGSSEVVQMWLSAGGGLQMYIRAGNGSGWATTWKNAFLGTMSLSGTTLTITSL